MSDAGAAASVNVKSERGPIVIGRYALFDELASGGMATVHLGRLLGPVGFGRTVAIKRLHEHYLKDDEFVAMFMDEARIVARIRHPNVVPMVDVVQSEKGLFLIMEYVHGETLSRLMRSARQLKQPIPVRIVTAVLYGVLLGLHGAHETKGADGKLLGVVHRDVSPQNVIVGADGTARVLDFGIAKAAGRAQVTREGQIKGKLAYMAPEQIRGAVDRRTDVFAASVVLWEALAGRRLHDGAKDVDIVTRVIKGDFPKPSQFAADIPPELDEIVLKGLATKPDQRYASARDLAVDLEKRVGLAPTGEVAAWVETLAADVLEERSKMVSAMEIVAADLIADEEAPPPIVSFAPSSSRMPSASEAIPIELDAPGSNDTGTGTGFAHSHTQAPSDPEGKTAPPPQNLRPMIALVGACALLAVIGLTLGAYALAQRGNGPVKPASSLVAPSSASPSSMPSGKSTSVSPPSSSAPPAASTLGTSPSSPDTSASSLASAAPSSAPSGATSAAAVSASAASAPAKAAQPPAFVPTKPPPKKPTVSCDPPYTVDEVGHRKYKTECLGLD
ncbi:MAG: serine/threonine protein kinase [Deltaproteobacteria bacterium]|nr:serine/threonine protein kinase [Deltaproteobacteria bacterium]